MSKRRQQTQVANFLRPAWLDDMGKRTGIGAAIVTPANSFKDYFDNYGGPGSQGGSDVLNWRQFARMESGELWTGISVPAPTFDDTWAVEGSTSVAITNSGGPSGIATVNFWFDSSQDLLAEGRFSAADYILIVADFPAVPDGEIFSVLLVSGGGASTAEFTFTSGISVGINYLKILRGGFFANFLFDWQDVTQIGLRFQHSETITVKVDDLRIVKADPDDASTFNDTGLIWDFAGGGVWHVYYRAVPGVPYSLGQIKTAASVRYTGTYVGERAYNAVRDVQVGVYLREEGRAGLWWGVDADNSYELILDTDADELELLKYVDGTPESLGVVDFPADTFTKYYLGLRRETTRLRVYCSASRVNLFDRANMQFAFEDRDYAGGVVGTVAEGVQAHFFEFQGGSPFHADTAQMAGAALEVSSAGDKENEIADALLLADGEGGSRWGTPLRSSAFAWGGRLQALKSLPGLRLLIAPHFGYVGSGSTLQVIDLSEQDHHLTIGNTVAPGAYQAAGLPEVPYALFSADNDKLTFADSAAFDIAGALTVIMFAWFDNAAAVTTTEFLMGKLTPAGNQRSYRLQHNTAGSVSFGVSADGTTTFSSAGTPDSYHDANRWYGIAGRFTPSTEVALFWFPARGGLEKFVNTSSIAASIFNSSTVFALGQRSDAGNQFYGRLSRVALYAAALSDDAIAEALEQSAVFYGL